jgi:hypothetical protein
MFPTSLVTSSGSQRGHSDHERSTLRSVAGPGRPPNPADQRRDVAVHVRLTAKHYDDIYKAAQQRGVSIPEYVRQQLRNTLALSRRDEGR